MSDGNRYDQTDSTISLEARFVQLYFNAIEELPKCWLNDSGFARDKFNQQVLFLISLLPYEEQQDEIMVAWNNRMIEIRELMPGLTQDEYTFSSNLVPVTKIMKFICAEFDLISTNITGPATSKQYREAAIQVPDMTKNPQEIT
jgi:hypothetical protein